MDESDLSMEELEKLVQFQEVTGVEDLTVARLELIQNNWNVEAAVQTRLSLQGSPQRTSNVRQRSQSFPNSRNTQSGHSNTDAIRPQPLVQSYSTWLWGLPSQIVMRIFKWCYYVLSLPMRIFVPYQRRLVDPLGDVTSFIAEYEKEYGVVHPVFFQGSYSQALNQAKTDLKFLLVYLHCQDNQDTPHFCRSVLSNSRLIEFVNSTVIFWACSVTTGEGYRVSQALRENAYPFLAVIVLKDNKMTLVGRLEGPQEASKLITQMEVIIRDSEAYLVVARADRQEREMTAAIRQEQDVAYLESLRADQEKSRKRQQELDAQSKQEQEEKEHEMSILEEKENRRRLKIEWVDRIPEEPEEDDDGVIQIVVKLPEGTRLNRRFKCDDSLAALYYYIFCHPDAPDRFQITTNFPRKVVPCEPSNEVPVPPSFEEFGLPQRSMLFIIDLDA